MLYHETRDTIVVKEFLGHKTLDTTLLYIQVEKALFRNELKTSMSKPLRSRRRSRHC